MKSLTLICALFLFASCGDDFRKVDALDRFRILTVIADNPEVAPGGTANLELFVSDPKGGGRIIAGTTVSCIDPGISVGADVSCDHDPARVTGTYTIDTTTADLTSNLFTGVSGSLAVTVPATILQGLSSREEFNGVGYIVIFTFTVDSQTVSTFKRIVATTRTTLNANPVGGVVQKNGGALGGSLQKEDKLTISGAAAESYDVVNVDGTQETKTETLSVAWYITHGEFDRPKTRPAEETEYQDSPLSSQMILVSVIRDERGGVQVLRESL